MKKKKHKIKLSFFESLALLAFLTFSKHKVHIAIIETGLGGRLDATNIITPILSIITSISYDHMNVLGNTLEKIATEKAGIIKYKIPIVLGPTAYKKPIIKIAKTKQAKILHVRKKTTDFYNEENIKIATKAIIELSTHFHLKQHPVKQALTLNPPCRFEVYKKNNSIIIFDVAHNLSAFKKLFYEINIKYFCKKFDLIITFSKSKDFFNIFKYLIKTPIINQIYILDINHSKLSPAKTIQSIFKSLKYNNTKILKCNKKETTKLIKNNLLITGSFFHMNKMKTYLSMNF